MKAKQSIFNQFILSFFNFNAYPGFAKERGGKVFVYSLLMVAVTFLVTVIIPFTEPFQIVMGMDESDIDNNIPYFEISDGNFFIERPFNLEDPLGGMFIYVTSDEVFPTEVSLDVLGDYSQGIIIDAEQMIVKTAYQAPMIFPFSSSPETNFSRADLYPLISSVKTAVLIMIPFLFALYIGIYMFGVLVCALIGMAVNAFIKAPLDFKGIYSVTAYARTASIILKMLLLLLPFGITLHFLAFYAIFILYMARALLAVKKTSEETEIINVSDNSSSL